MYKILLVDDEVLIRESIEDSIEWNQLGYDLIGSCANGRQAIEMIESNPPDLVLTDICMPFIDGLDLAKYINENHPEIQVVIISGYDNFAYAKKAIKYQVMEYVLKPVTAKELSEILLKVGEKIEENRMKARQMNRMKSSYLKNQPVLKERFLNQLLKKNYVFDPLEQKLKEYQIYLEGSDYAAIQIQCRKMDHDAKELIEVRDEAVLFAVYNALDELLKGKENCIVFQNMSSLSMIILSGESDYQVMNYAKKICHIIQPIIYQYLSIHTVAIAGKSVRSLKELYQSYESIKEILPYQYLAKNDQIFLAQELKKTSETIDSQSWVQRLYSVIYRNNPINIEYEVSQFVGQFRYLYFKQDEAGKVMKEVLEGVVERCEDVIGQSLTKKLLMGNNIQLSTYLEQKWCLENLEKDTIRFCKKLADTLIVERGRSNEQQALRALEYIEKNYQDENISLDSVCNYLSMSISRFSSIFKDYTGETFIEALTRKRMEKAEELLLNTALKTYEVASETGYYDPHYFSSVFKRYTGMTPRAFRKKGKKDER
ncbi:MAG TPA: response regulator [Candidatus Merdenecus merdavium]|nr:response regulator [Candidatus Merdenecus merdavium]